MPSFDPLVARAFQAPGINPALLTTKGGVPTDGTTCFFTKTSTNVAQAVGEAESLKHLGLTAPPGFVPRVFGLEVDAGGNKAGMVSEYFDLGGRKDQRRLGESLAQVHRPPPADAPDVKRGMYGFHVPTHCGETEQDNTWESDWKTFFVERRVGDLVRRLGDNEVRALWDEMQQGVVPLLLDDFSPAPEPVIVHGDLWSGNVAANKETGLPVVFDPSSTYAHNEFELGICHMFGGFTKEFFDAYHAVHPRSEPHHDQRIKLYELYHHLNHALMFGFGYKSGAKSIMKSLIAYDKTQRD